MNNFYMYGIENNEYTNGISFFDNSRIYAIDMPKRLEVCGFNDSGQPIVEWKIAKLENMPLH